jgi:hypothetical protein
VVTINADIAYLNWLTVMLFVAALDFDNALIGIVLDEAETSVMVGMLLLISFVNSDDGFVAWVTMDAPILSDEALSSQAEAEIDAGAMLIKTMLDDDVANVCVDVVESARRRLTAFADIGPITIEILVMAILAAVATSSCNAAMVTGSLIIVAVRLTINVTRVPRSIVTLLLLQMDVELAVVLTSDVVVAADDVRAELVGGAAVEGLVVMGSTWADDEYDAMDDENGSLDDEKGGVKEEEYATVDEYGFEFGDVEYRLFGTRPLLADQTHTQTHTHQSIFCFSTRDSND